MNVVDTLTAEHDELTQRLNDLDERHRTERPGLVAQISQLSKAIAALTKPAKSLAPRKPMSEEGKAAIRAGLEKARDAKFADSSQSADLKPSGPKDDGQTGADKPAVAQPVAGSNPAQALAKKPAASDKAPSRVN